MTNKNDDISGMLGKMMAVSALNLIEMGLRIAQSRILDKDLARSYTDKLIALNDKLELDTDPVTIKQIADQTKDIVEEVVRLPLTQARDWGAIISATLPNFRHIIQGSGDGFDRDQFRVIINCVRDILRDMTPISLDTDDDKSVVEAIEDWDKSSAVKQVLHQLDVSVTQVVLGVVTVDQAVASANAAKGQGSSYYADHHTLTDGSMDAGPRGPASTTVYFFFNRPKPEPDRQRASIPATRHATRSSRPCKSRSQNGKSVLRKRACARHGYASGAHQSPNAPNCRFC